MAYGGVAAGMATPTSSAVPTLSCRIRSRFAGNSNSTILCSRSHPCCPWARQKGEPLAARNYFPELKAEGKGIVRAIGSTPAGRLHN